MHRGEGEEEIAGEKVARLINIDFREVGVMIGYLRKIYYLTLTSSIFAVYVGCTPPDSNAQIESITSQQNNNSVSIAYLKGLCSDITYYIYNDIYIEGVVTANNAFGEFTNGVIIEDNSGAIEILCDVDCVASGFVVGTTLRVSCSGLYLGSTGGMIALGNAPESTTPATQLDEEQVSQHIQIKDVEIAELAPLTITIPALTTQNILQYVWLENLNVVPSDIRTFCSRDPESGQTQYTTHTLVDNNGNQITLEVNRNASYADDDIPTSTFATTAIIEYFNGEYNLRIVNNGVVVL